MHVKRMIRKRASLLAAMIALIVAGISSAAGADPVWRLEVLSNTTALPGQTITFYLEAMNKGTSDTDGSTITNTVTLPAGVTAVSASGTVGGFGPLPCTAGDGSSPVAGASTIRCDTTSIVPPLQHGGASQGLHYTIVATASSGIAKPTTLRTSFGISGGGAFDSVSTADAVRIDDLPSFGVANFDNAAIADPSGEPFTQAGGHPYGVTASIDFNTVNNPLPMIGDLWPVEPLRDVVADLPPGFVGGTAGVDQCTAAELANSSGFTAEPFCSVTSQVGNTLIRLNGFGVHPYAFGPVPVFNMVPPPGAPAEFGFNIFGSVVTFTARVRSGGDYGLSVDVNQLPEAIALEGTTLTFWGVPSDPSHDSERACSGQGAPWEGGPTCTSGARPSAFLRNPTSCAAPVGSPVQDGLVTNLWVDSWDDPGARDANGAPVVDDPRWQTTSVVSHDLPGYPEAPGSFGSHLLPTGCDKVPFDPKLTFQPSAPARAGMPTGFQVDLDLPQTNDPTVVGESDLKKAVVTLPEDTRVSASSADGLGACSPDQIGLHNTADPTCPDSSKVGTLQITTPLLDTKLNGSIYLATPNDNPFHSLLAIYIVAQGAGVTVKLAGHVEADAKTGQLKTTFDNNPQVPFSNLHLEFMSGARAPLVAPAACGTYTTHAELYSWSQPDTPVTSDSSFTVDQSSDGSACAPNGFSPGFSAGTQSPVAGASTSFLLRLTRGDSDQEFSSLSVDMPTGALAKIASVTPCPDGAANGGACQDSAKIGNVTVGAGAGPNPFYIQTGRAYLTGPYKGAPFGLSIVVPAVAGPFDLGNVVVRAKLDVDRRTAQAHVIADPLPTILQGIPLDVRDIRTTIDRPNFFVNPTSCAPKNVLATVGSTLGTIAHLSTHFQMAGCEGLPLAPKLSFTVGAKRHTQAGVSTPLTTTLTQTPGQSNLKTVSVTLPGTLNALLPVVNRACKLAEFDAGKCTSRAKIGTVSMTTPLLRDPLRGSAYFVKNPARPIPDLMFALRGQVSLDVTGKVRIPGGTRLATTFDTIPDAPITKLTLRIVSGKNGPIGIRTNLCSAKGRASAAAIAYRGQNGALLKVNQRVHINGCPKAAKAKRTRRH